MPGEHICTHLDSNVLDHAKRYCKEEDVEVWGQPGKRSRHLDFGSCISL